MSSGVNEGVGSGDAVIAADNPDRPSAKLVTVTADGRIRHLPRTALGTLFRAGDLPVMGVWYALPLIKHAGSEHIGDEVFNVGSGTETS